MVDRFRTLRFLVLGTVLFAGSGCFRLVSSEGGGQTGFNAPRQIDPTDPLISPFRTGSASSRSPPA